MKIRKELSKDLKKETRRRIKKMNEEFNSDPEVTIFENKKGYNQIIAQTDIQLMALCPHHHLPFWCEVSIGYIPNEWVMGLSKFARIAEKHIHPRKKILQEEATQQIMNDFKKLKPKGVIVVIKGQHSCIAFRGIRKPSTTITSAVSGVFATNDGARQEFLQLIK